HTRHHNVEQHQIDRLTVDQVQRILPPRGAQCAVVSTEQVLKNGDIHRLVIDDQHRRLVLRRHAVPSPCTDINEQTLLCPNLLLCARKERLNSFTNFEFFIKERLFFLTGLYGICSRDAPFPTRTALKLPQQRPCR